MLYIILNYCFFCYCYSIFHITLEMYMFGIDNEEIDNTEMLLLLAPLCAPVQILSDFFGDD